MATDLLVNCPPHDRLFHGFLNQVFIDGVPPHLAAARIDRQAFGREHLLPDPFSPRIRILSFPGRPDVDSSRSFRQILLINGLHMGKMLFQRAGKTL